MILAPERVFGAVVPGAQNGGLPERCKALLRQQRETWPMCRDGYASLDRVQTRSLGLHGYALHLQYNPGRIVSTGAKVDPASIRQRRCFLCVDHLPPEQHALLYGNDLLILCNPAPIFPEHFTISHREHRPQEIGPFTETMLRLASDLAPAYCLFYNGPRCGASAPDHLHFQAGPAGAIPTLVEAGTDAPKVLRTIGPVDVATIAEYGRTVAVLRSRDAGELANLFLHFIAVWRTLLRSDEEPMMNVLSAVENGVHRLIVFLRRKHRPDAYFLEGEQQVLVSPAAVDIGGFVVTPREREFRSLNEGSMAAIFKEVSTEPSILQQICEAL